MINRASLDKRQANTRKTGMSQSALHEAAALGAVTLFSTIHRGLMATGFDQGGILGSRDGRIGIIINIIVVIWIGLVSASGWLLPVQAQSVIVSDVTGFKIVPGIPQCVQGVFQCLALYAYCPVILISVAIEWVVWVICINFERSRSWVWKARTEFGPYMWWDSLPKWFRGVQIVMLLVFSLPTAVGATAMGLYSLAILNIVGSIVFLAEGTGENNYDSARAIYTRRVRVVLMTSHLHGTVYLLPTVEAGFGAVWSPKIKSEHTPELREYSNALRALENGTGDLKDIRIKLRSVATEVSNRTRLPDQTFEAMATWLLNPSHCQSKVEWSKVKKEKNKTIITREIVFAIYQLEFILFTFRDKLTPASLEKLWTWRDKRLTGASGAFGGEGPIGSKGGYAGLREALHAVSECFGVDETCVDSIFQVDPPNNPRFKELPNSTIEQYAGALWDMSIRGSESLAMSLCCFFAVWFPDVGNHGGNHLFGIKAKSNEGEIDEWLIIWRQGWYSAITTQLITLSPAIIGAFVSGVLGT
ncbi:uncharacterized protein VTP21DRAFT_7734 [Calcarisporiella thermophila]|uniref:uncharacterized protein n=1 Tax=Calcarisporiella thermophila TaxID=911321 RepID=UPI0037423F9E